MSIEKAIVLGEAKVKEMAEKKETDRLAALSPEAKEAEAKESADKAVLEAKDETLDEAGKAKKAELLEAQKKSDDAEEKRILEAKELEPDEEILKAEILEKKKAEKEAEKEANIQKRIDEIAGELKAEKAARAKDQEKIAALEAEQKKLAHSPKNTEEELDKLEQTRISKLLESDKALPKEKRREMSDEDLQEWLVEDMVAAQRWLSKQEVRRDKERSADEAKLKGEPADEMKTKAETVIRKQAESNARVFAKHPELNVTKRVNDLKAEGKSDKEIRDIIKNDPKCKLALEIIQENQSKYLLSEDGPEMFAAEIERRMKSSPKGETQEERDKRIADEAVEAERLRIANIDEGMNSTRGKGSETKMSDSEKAQWNIFQKANPKKTLADFRANQQRRKERTNA